MGPKISDQTRTPDLLIGPSALSNQLGLASQDKKTDKEMSERQKNVKRRVEQAKASRRGV